MEWQALIQAQPALAHVPSGLQAVAKRRKTQAGEPLFRQGERPRRVFFVCADEVRLLRRARNGAEIILQRSRGGYLAEASLGAKSYHCDAVTTETAVVLCFPIRVFLEALHEDSTFQQVWATHLAHEVRRLRAQCERLNLKGASDRIIHYVEAEGVDGSVTLHRSRKAWARELGLTHEALYRTLRRMKAEGTLHVGMDRISIARK